MKRPAPSDDFDDSFDDDDDAFLAFEVPENVPSTSTTPPPPKYVMPSPPKRAFVFRPSQPVKLNTFSSDSALPGIQRPDENANRSAFSSSVGAKGQAGPAAGASNQPGPSGSAFPNQGRPMGAGQSAFRPPGAVQNQQRPPVPIQSQIRPNSAFRNQNQPYSNTGPQNQPRPPNPNQNQYRPSQTSTLQRSTSVQNPVPQNLTSQNRPNAPRPANVHPSQPHFQQAFRPPGGPFPPLPNATKVNIPRPQDTTTTQTASSSQLQRTVSFPPPGSNQNTQNQNQNQKPAAPPPLRTNSQFPNIPTKEQVMQWRAAAAVATQRWYGPSQQQRYQRPMINQSRGPGPSQMSQRPGMGLNQTQQRFMAPNQTPRFMTSQAQQRFMNQTPQRPGMSGQRPMGSGSIQRPPFRPLGTGQRPPVPAQSQRPVPNEVVPASQSPFSLKSSLSTSSGTSSDLPPAAKEEISRLKGAIEFLEVKYKTKDRDHNVLAFKFKNEVTSRKDLSTEIDRLKVKNEELNQQFIKEQMEKASLQAALEKAQAEADAAKKEKLKSPAAFPVPTVVKAKFPPSIEEVRAAGQLPAKQPAEAAVSEARNDDNDDAVTVADAEEPTKPTRWCEPEDVLSRLSYRKEMEFFLECPDLKKPKVNIHEVVDKYRTFFNLKNLERDANGVIIPPPHVSAAKEAKGKKKKKQPEKPAEKTAPPPPEPAKPPPPQPDPVFKVPEIPKRLQPHKMTRTNLRLPPSFRITVPKKRFKKPLSRGQTERPIETEEEKKEREIKEKEEDEKKRLIELEKAKARRKLLNINRKSKKSAVPEPPPPPPKWTPILSLTEMAKPRVLRPYEKKEAAVKKAKEHAKARAAAANAEEVEPVEQMEVDPT